MEKKKQEAEPTPREVVSPSALFFRALGAITPGAQMALAKGILRRSQDPGEVGTQIRSFPQTAEKNKWPDKK